MGRIRTIKPEMATSEPLGDMGMPACRIPGCDASVKARGWCHKHYRRWRTHGFPHLVGVIRGDPVARMAAYIDGVESGCWQWTGALLPDGYGRFWDGQRLVYAHRAVYEFCVGPIPEGLTIDHLCRNRACVNPAHMEPVTLKVNILRGEGPTARHARQTSCIQGHLFTPETTHIDRQGERACRVCQRERSAARRGTLKATARRGRVAFADPEAPG